jgi:hypothetical protein
MKIVAEHYHQEYVYQFLMGLNESFAAIRGQILLMEPLPSVNKVFSMITQEEKQQEIFVKTQALNLDSAALMTTPVNRFVKQPYWKDKPICTHYGNFTQASSDGCLSCSTSPNSSLPLPIYVDNFSDFPVFLPSYSSPAPYQPHTSPSHFHHNSAPPVPHTTPHASSSLVPIPQPETSEKLIFILSSKSRNTT